MNDQEANLLDDEEILEAKTDSDAGGPYRILVGLDGSEESYRSLRYAAYIGSGIGADITLLYVRPIDQGLNSGGMQVRVARENMLEWGLDLPGMRVLKKGRDILFEIGFMKDDWEKRTVTKEVSGDPLGDTMTEYQCPSGKRIRMRLKVSDTPEQGILAQQEEGKHDLIILGASGERMGKLNRFLGIASTALKVVLHAPCSVLIARQLKSGNGHLICTDGSEKALDMVVKDASIAYRCRCPISLLSVYKRPEEKERAIKAIDDAKNALMERDIEVVKSEIKSGDPVQQILESVENRSVIVVGESGSTAIERFFMGSTALNLLHHSPYSVLVVR
ncbi:MAG: universal stress protein [Magnetococcales bacterium]|nr:universal stress protein [Magnetococcales bacterium]